MSRRLTALVIGNAAYEHAGVLTNPTNDAEDIATKLAGCGFTVSKAIDCSVLEMDRALKRFKKSLADNDVGLFFFAGHGMQIEGENYLAAVNTDTAGEDEAKYSSLALNRVIEVMEKAGTSTNIIILDACRDNPFERAWRRSAAARGLAPVYAPKGTLIAFATSPGQVASDGKGRNGAYTAALLRHIETPDCSIESMFKRVRNTLSAATRTKQISWEHTSLSGEFFFNLSLGVRIDAYSDTALSDSLFVLDEAKRSHQVIRKLKSHTWPTQNPAVDEFTAEATNKASVDALFVIGRNFYQAACGSSKSAIAYLCDFVARTQKVKPDKRKALLDGMLFEVFYDPKAQLRKTLKTGMFLELFSLQLHKELAPSFEFIAECLLPHTGRFHALPGKTHAVVVDVVTTKDGAANHILESLHCGGASILRLEDPDDAQEPGEQPRREKLDLARFEARLAEQMVVPAHLLTINYQSFHSHGSERIMFPYGWTARIP
ncbi:MAG: Peptidase caspase catalytic subunit p20 [Herbaspirillum sp.]|nr:Peptidase caspase catalytic subunit p20 [Herbaspirillum sp.]